MTRKRPGPPRGRPRGARPARLSESAGIWIRRIERDFVTPWSSVPNWKVGMVEDVCDDARSARGVGCLLYAKYAKFRASGHGLKPMVDRKAVLERYAALRCLWHEI
eukprot:466666-Prymnesium_polylepis.1